MESEDENSKVCLGDLLDGLEVSLEKEDIIYLEENLEREDGDNDSNTIFHTHGLSNKININRDLNRVPLENTNVYSDVLQPVDLDDPEELIPEKRFAIDATTSQISKSQRTTRGIPGQKFVSYESFPVSKEKTFTCELCGLRLTTKESRRRHILSKHIKERTNICNECGRAFIFKFALKSHKATHADTAKFVCICGQSFSIRSSYNDHVRRIHQAAPNVKYQCQLCFKEFGERATLRIHLISVHKPKTIACLHKGCPKLFSTIGLMRSHYRYHLKQKFACDECGQVFSTEAYMYKHRLSHSGIRPYVCIDCGKSYLSMSHLNKHRRVAHSTVRPFQCSMCGKCYKTKDQLTFHENSHRGEKPFKCEICGYATAYRNTYYAHRKNHTTNGMEKPKANKKSKSSIAEISSETKSKTKNSRSKGKPASLKDISLISSNIKHEIRAPISLVSLSTTNQGIRTPFSVVSTVPKNKPLITSTPNPGIRTPISVVSTVLLKNYSTSEPTNTISDGIKTTIVTKALENPIGTDSISKSTISVLYVVSKTKSEADISDVSDRSISIVNEISSNTDNTACIDDKSSLITFHDNSEEYLVGDLDNSSTVKPEEEKFIASVLGDSSIPGLTLDDHLDEPLLQSGPSFSEAIESSLQRAMEQQNLEPSADDVDIVNNEEVLISPDRQQDPCIILSSNGRCAIPACDTGDNSIVFLKIGTNSFIGVCSLHSFTDGEENDMLTNTPLEDSRWTDGMSMITAQSSNSEYQNEAFLSLAETSSIIDQQILSHTQSIVNDSDLHSIQSDGDDMTVLNNYNDILSTDLSASASMSSDISHLSEISDLPSQLGGPSALLNSSPSRSGLSCSYSAIGSMASPQLGNMSPLVSNLSNPTAPGGQLVSQSLCSPSDGGVYVSQGLSSPAPLSLASQGSLGSPAPGGEYGPGEDLASIMGLSGSSVEDSLGLSGTQDSLGPQDTLGLAAHLEMECPMCGNQLLSGKQKGSRLVYACSSPQCIWNM